MGAQQSFQWAALYPDMVARLACLCGTAKTTEHNRVFLESLRAAIRADQSFADGFYEAPPRLGLRATGRIYAGWAYSQEWYRRRCYRELGFISLDDFFVRYWDALFEKRDANSIMAMTSTWIHNDISANEVFAGDLRRRARRHHGGDGPHAVRDRSLFHDRGLAAPSSRISRTPASSRSLLIGGTWPVPGRAARRPRSSTPS